MLANVVIILTPLSRQRVTCHMSSIVGAGNDPARGHAMVRGSTVTRPTLVNTLGASGGPRTLIRTETLGFFIPCKILSARVEFRSEPEFVARSSQ